MTALKPEHLQLVTGSSLDGAKPTGPATPLRRSGGFFRRHRRPSATSSTVSSTPTFFSSTRSRQSHFPGLSPSESSACGCTCRHHELPPPREAEALLCCLAPLLRRRADREPCSCGGNDCAPLSRAISIRSSRHCLFDSSPYNSSSGGGHSGNRYEEDFALLDLRPQPPPLPPRRRHHSLGSAHAWVHPGATALPLGPACAGGPPQLPPRPQSFLYLPRYLAVLHRCPFYWGRTDARRAEAVLAAAKSGTYLLRDSSNADYLFTLSYRWADEIIHLRLEAVKQHLFALDPSSHLAFGCPVELVNYYRDHKIYLDRTALLLQPLRRPFVFSLSALSRVAVCSRARRNADLDQLHLPPAIVAYLRYYCRPLIPTLRLKQALH